MRFSSPFDVGLVSLFGSSCNYASNFAIFCHFAIMDIFLIGGRMKYIANIHNTYLITCILDFEEKAPNDRKDNGGKEKVSN